MPMISYDTSLSSLCLILFMRVGASRFFSLHCGNRVGSARWLQRILYVATRKSIFFRLLRDRQERWRDAVMGRTRCCCCRGRRPRESSKEGTARWPVHARDCIQRRRSTAMAYWRACRPRSATVLVVPGQATKDSSARQRAEATRSSAVRNATTNDKGYYVIIVIVFDERRCLNRGDA